jgi:hypothetical protein
MTRTTRSLSAFVLLAAISGGAGCATAAGGHPDVHGMTTLPGGGSDGRLLIAGPALLMHIELDRGDDLVLYTVARKHGTDADCAVVPDGGSIRVRARNSNLLNLGVAGGRVVCISSPSERTSVLWHAKAGEPAAPEARGQMLAARAQRR